MFGVFNASCERRLRVLELECFLFGFGICVLKLKAKINKGKKKKERDNVMNCCQASHYFLVLPFFYLSPLSLKTYKRFTTHLVALYYSCTLSLSSKKQHRKSYGMFYFFTYNLKCKIKGFVNLIYKTTTSLSHISAPSTTSTKNFRHTPGYITSMKPLLNQIIT